MKKAILLLFLLGGRPLFAQSTTVFIRDSNGNQTVGTIDDGNVYFHDSNGNVAFGTIRDGNVFLTTSKGETTFGTVKDGNVFLTDQKGITTGTIRDGNIFLSNSDGSVTTGTYTRSGDVYTSTSPGSVTQRQTVVQKFADGYAVGQGIGSMIYRARVRHAFKKVCKQYGPSGWLRLANGATMYCNQPNAIVYPE